MVSELEYAAFLDLVYGASAEPSLWGEVICRFADLVGAEKAWMPSLDVMSGDGSGIVARIDPAKQAEYFQHYASVNPFLSGRANVPDQPLNILTDEHYLDKQDFFRTEYYNDFLRPQGIHSAVVIHLGQDGDTQTTLNLTRPARKGQFETEALRTAKLLQGHLIRALALGRRFAAKLGEDRPVLEGLHAFVDRIPGALFLVDGQSRIVHCNGAARALLSGRNGLSAMQGVLEPSLPDDRRQLRALVARAASPDPQLRRGGAMPLRSGHETRALAIQVAPARREHALALADESLVIVFVADPAAQAPISLERLNATFGFTPAEGRIAAELLAGRDAQAISERQGLSLHTVRVQIARILGKTNTSRQGEFISLALRTFGGSWLDDG
jgi:DNA-binding CsgD family transcriptional regulator